MGDPQIIVPPPPERPADAHKGTFGTVVVVGGAHNMIGAPALAATAALRAGAGLVKIMTWPDVLPHCLTIEPSATGIPVPYYDDPNELAKAVKELHRERTVLAVGPGMSVRPVVQRGLAHLFSQDFPLVLDADGLNNLAEMHRPRVQCPWVMTPHPGEYRRLAKAAGIDLDPTDPERRGEAAAALARHHRAVVLLKGRHTVISDGDRTAVNRTGNPALAAAGSGDVLTGVIAALIAQGMERFEAAVLGAHVHGLAADLWAQRVGPVGMLARDLAALIPEALETHRRDTAG